MGEASRHYRQLWRHTLVRLLLTYLAPLLLLTAYFHLQFHSLSVESRRRHLQSIAENQASTLDLFLRERVGNLTNLIDDPRLPQRPPTETTQEALQRLQRDSNAFVDLGFFDQDGVMLSYAGPFSSLLGRSYGDEPWFRRLKGSSRRYVITDMYLGFRQRPHFTIAVRSATNAGPAAIRATIDPEGISQYMTTLRGSREVQSVLVSAAGSYQSVELPEPLVEAGEVLVPPRSPGLGADVYRGRAGRFDYAYCWLDLTDWVLLVLWTGQETGSFSAGLNVSFVAISASVILALFSTIVIRATQVVRRRRAEDSAKEELSDQLRHAARLASVGELAAGVAHEINNPLAVIAEETGLMQDLMNPELGRGLSPEELNSHLRAIHEAVFRARDITRKLLTFVRKQEVTLGRHDVNEVVEGVVGGFLEREMAISNIEVGRRYADGLPPVLADRGQLEQVLFNLVANAIDAMPDGGRLTVSTANDDGAVKIAVSDTGVGIAPEQLETVFMPFHTTKGVGKGTGLGLSVSYGIVKSHGGDLRVASRLGEGSTFTVRLPVVPASATGLELEE